MRTAEAQKQLKVALMLSSCKHRDALQVGWLRLATATKGEIRETSALSPITIRWPISEVEEDEGEGARLNLRLHSHNPLYIAAVKRLIPFLMRRAGRELLIWRMSTREAKASQTPTPKSMSQVKVLRALNLIARRKLFVAWLSWNSYLPQNTQETEESTITVRRQVVIERITYLRQTDKYSSPLSLFRRTLLSLQLRQKALKLKAFTWLKAQKTTEVPQPPSKSDAFKRILILTGIREKIPLSRAFWALKPSSSLEPPSKLSVLKRILLLTGLRQQLSLSRAFWSFKPPKVLIKTMDPALLQSIKAFETLFTHLLTTNSLTPVFARLRQKEIVSEEEIETIPDIPLPLTSVMVSPGKADGKEGVLVKKVWKPFKLRLKWAWKALSAKNAKTQRRRFYRIQKGMKALYSASILRRLNETWDLLKFLLYMQGKKGRKFRRLPLFAYPIASVVTCQRLIRGFIGRRQVRGLRRHLQESPEAMLTRYQTSMKAVLLIQRYVRGFTQRRRAAQLRALSSGRPVLKGQVLSSRLILLAKALQKPVKRTQAEVLPKLAIRNRRAYIKRCIKLQKAGKEIQKLLQTLAFRVIQTGTGS